MLLDEMCDHFGMVDGDGRMENMASTKKRRDFGRSKTGKIRRFCDLRPCSGEMALVPNDGRIVAKSGGVASVEGLPECIPPIETVVGWISSAGE